MLVPQTSIMVSQAGLLNLPVDKLPIYDKIAYWSPDELEDERDLKKVSETTAKILRYCFASTMLNEK